jgi:signal transduction histidine kinase
MMADGLSEVVRLPVPNPVQALSAVAVRGFRSAGEAARVILGLIHELVGLRVCVITRVDLDANTLTVIEAVDKANLGIAPGMVVPADQMPCDYVVRTATPVREYDLETHPVFSKMAVPAKLGLRSYIGVPLKRSDGTIWGTLAVTDTSLRETTEAHLVTLTLLARLLVLEYECEEQRDAAAAHAKLLAERLAMAEALEEERLRAVRLQTVLEAAATVSHGINNPLTVLQLRLGQLRKRVSPQDAESLDAVEIAAEATEEIKQVTMQFRNVVQPVSTQYLAGSRTRMFDLAASIKKASGFVRTDGVSVVSPKRASRAG